MVNQKKKEAEKLTNNNSSKEKWDVHTKKHMISQISIKSTTRSLYDDLMSM